MRRSTHARKRPVVVPAQPRIKLDECVLVVDDRADVLRALDRLLKSRVQTVYSALTPREAEQILLEAHPTCLLCDYWLGEGQPLATTLIPEWRRKCPSLKCVALMTGTNSSSIARCQEVDHIFHKPLDIREVVAFFAKQCGHEPVAERPRA